MCVCACVWKKCSIINVENCKKCLLEVSFGDECNLLFDGKKTLIKLLSVFSQFHNV